jgi:histidinol phosphatase-like PHP family hydrolase/predicted phosphodiesterase
MNTNNLNQGDHTPLNLLVLADPHFVGVAQHTCNHPERLARLGQILLRKALWRLKHLGVKPDAIVLLGDMVDDGTKPGAQEDWQALAGEVHKTGIPVLAVPGNHDNGTKRFAQVFGCEPGMHVVGDYVFLVFHDERQNGELFRRPADQLDLPARAAAAYPGKPIIALQHHPYDPVIREGYPYHLTNRAEVMAGYRDAGVCLSLSGHYHAGQAAHEVDGVSYATAPALCEAPFRFLLIRMEGRRAQIQEHALRHDVPGLADNHCHTELAYCGTTASIADGIRLSQALGVETLCFTEHAFQLYFERDVAWSFKWQTDPAMKQAVWSTPERSRMASYRKLAAGFRTNRVRAGLEVDLCADGSLLLAPQDADGWDLLVGAVHEIHDFRKGVTSQAETEELFLRDVQRLLAHPIDALAHPFRFFPRKGLQKPVHLYPVVADLLADSGVAAEINFHTNHSEPEFFRHCLERGVKISLASDSHELSEYGEFTPHLRVLAEAGAAPADIPRILLRPRGV